MILNEVSENLISMLQNSGYKAYLVGGFVRDYLMNREAGDVDITTSATPLEVEQVLEKNRIKYIETGLKYGTITAIIDHVPYEITTFRSEGTYLDNRHPDEISFVDDVKYDLARRDFTMNAVAYNKNEGFVDFFNSVDDINNRIIRCVGNPDERFKEDALRIMRALRFSSVLGFDIEPLTKKAIFDNKDLLSNIAVERVFLELSKLLLGDNVRNVLLEYKEVFAVIIPELSPTFDFHQNIKWHIYDVYTHSVVAVDSAEKDLKIRLSALLHDIGKPNCCVTDSKNIDHFKGHPAEGADMAKVILRRFKVSNDIYNTVVNLVTYHDDHITLNSSVIKRWLRKLGVDLTLALIDLKIADLLAHNMELAETEVDTLLKIKELTNRIIASGEPYLISHLDVNGKDLIKLGYCGRDIADELDNLVRLVSASPELNDKEVLINQAKKDLG